MRWWIAVVVALAPLVAAADDPRPKPVDIKAIRDQVIVLTDAAGGVYVVKPGDDARMFYGTGKTLYEQVVTGRSANEDGWSVETLAPRAIDYQPGSIVRHPGSGELDKYCGNDNKTGLTQVTGDKAKAILDKSRFMTTALIRGPHALLRDDAATYYYVDVLRKEYGGKGYRVLVGKKGALKPLPLADTAIDSAGEVFVTKGGNLRLVIEAGEPKSGSWAKGEKKTSLTMLDLDRDAPVIYRELGVYTFLGTICDDL